MKISTAKQNKKIGHKHIYLFLSQYETTKLRGIHFSFSTWMAINHFLPLLFTSRTSVEMNFLFAVLFIEHYTTANPQPTPIIFVFLFIGPLNSAFTFLLNWNFRFSL